jgi:hypothetical protein
LLQRVSRETPFPLGGRGFASMATRHGSGRSAPWRLQILSGEGICAPT